MLFKGRLFITLLVFTFGAFAENVYIPNSHFKAHLLSNPRINTNNDSEISVKEAEAYTANIICSNNIFISDLTGIKSFVNLEQLDCSSNRLFNLDVSGLTKLSVLKCSNNHLSTLDVSSLTGLRLLECQSNSLTNLTVSGLDTLITLDCSENSLTKLDVSGLTNLKFLYCSYNMFSNENPYFTLDISDLTSLQQLNCSNNNLISLDVSGLTSLKSLYCSNNNLKSLDVSSLTNFTYLDCQGNNSLRKVCIAANQNILNWKGHCRWETNCSVVGLEEIISEKGLTILKTYNLRGQEVPLDTTGEVIIVLYDNGQREKMIVIE